MRSWGLPRGRQRGGDQECLSQACQESITPMPTKNDPKIRGAFFRAELGQRDHRRRRKAQSFRSRAKIDAEGKPRFQGFSRRRPACAARAPGGGFESHTFRTGGAGGFKRQRRLRGYPSTACSAVPRRAGARSGGKPYLRVRSRCDRASISIFPVAMTVSLEEGGQGWGEKRIRLPDGQRAQCQDFPAGPSRPASRSG